MGRGSAGPRRKRSAAIAIWLRLHANAFLLCPVFAFFYPIRKARLSLAASLGIERQDDRSKVANLLAAYGRLR